MEQKRTYKDITRARVTDTREVIVAKNMKFGGFTLSEIATVTEGGRERRIFEKWKLNIATPEYLENLKDALEAALFEIGYYAEEEPETEELSNAEVGQPEPAIWPEERIDPWIKEQLDSVLIEEQPEQGQAEEPAIQIVAEQEPEDYTTVVTDWGEEEETDGIPDEVKEKAEKIYKAFNDGAIDTDQFELLMNALPQQAATHEKEVAENDDDEWPEPE